MANSFHQLYVHLVFAPKYRRALIEPEMKVEVEKHISGIAKNIGCWLLEIYAMPDHTHILLRFKTTHTVAEIVNKIKTNSSRWIATSFHIDFNWQDGGGYFTLGYSQINMVRRYIRNQAQHHKGQTMVEEFEALLIEHGLQNEVPPKYWLVDPS